MHDFILKSACTLFFFGDPCLYCFFDGSGYIRWNPTSYNNTDHGIDILDRLIVSSSTTLLNLSMGVHLIAV